MSSSYPLNCEVVCADRVARWRPLVNWAQPPEEARRPEPSQLITGPPGAAPAGSGKAYAPRHAVDATPAGAGKA